MNVTSENVRSSALIFIAKSGSIGGDELRKMLDQNGYKMSRPSFYIMMSKLVESGLVSQWDESETIDGIKIQLRHFQLCDLQTEANQ